MRLAVLQQRPAQAFEAGSVSAQAAGLVHGVGRVGHDVEFVEGDARVGKIIRHALDEGWRHVDTHARDLLRRALMGTQELARLPDGLGIPAFGDKHHLALEASATKVR